MEGTVQTINGFKIDLNRVSRREFHDFISRIADAQIAGRGLEADMITGELLTRVMIAWPFEPAISTDAYLDLPLHDGKQVDQALEKAIEALMKKK